MKHLNKAANRPLSIAPSSSLYLYMNYRPMPDNWMGLLATSGNCTTTLTDLSKSQLVNPDSSSPTGPHKHLLFLDASLAKTPRVVSVGQLYSAIFLRLSLIMQVSSDHGCIHAASSSLTNKARGTTTLYRVSYECF